MPSFPHEGIRTLFLNRPSLAAELLGEVLGFAVPRYAEARIASEDLTEVQPVEHRADLVVLLVDGTPVHCIVVEVQLAPHADKRWAWPVYVATARARFRCPAHVLVVCRDAATACWAAAPIELAEGGSVVRPVALGPGALPVVTDVEVARRDPELAVLSAQAHRNGPSAVPVALAALGATVGLDDERVRVYTDLVIAALPAAARRALEELMATGTYTYQSDFAKKYYGQGLSRSIVAVLAARGIPLSDEARARVESCTDPKQLERWVTLAVTAASADELFD